MHKVVVMQTQDRSAGVKGSLKALGLNPVKGKEVLIKPNFNTADIAPGSTHNDTLAALIDEIWEMGASDISLGERSFPETKAVMTQKGVLSLLEQKQVRLLDFDQLADRDWVKCKPEGTLWKDGFRVARPILEAECLVATCCLKTHQFGGVFTMALKLAVGVVPTVRHGYDYMSELHQSNFQQELISDINAAFAPDIVVLDGIDAFVDQGPATGKRAKGNLFLASSDRVAIDATGVAMLKHLGSNEAIMKPAIFAQRQLARAAELGLGAKSAADIELVAADEASTTLRDALEAILKTA